MADAALFVIRHSSFVILYSRSATPGRGGARVSRTIVTVFGSSDAPPGTFLYALAYELGAEIARAGWTLCNGGYGGTMQAAAHGAVEAGGHTIGVTCSAFRGRAGANPYIRQEVPTFDLFTRLNTLIRLGRAYVVLPGGSGTLLELAAVWELLNKGLVRDRGPIVLLGAHWEPVVGAVRAAQPEALPLEQVDDVATAIEQIRLQVTAGS
jgi:uncharacterized protein (TIGR00730 family)